MDCKVCGLPPDDCLYNLMRFFILNDWPITKCNAELTAHNHKGTVEFLNGRLRYVPYVEPPKPEPVSVPVQVIPTPIIPKTPIHPTQEIKQKPRTIIEEQPVFKKIPKKQRGDKKPVLLAVRISFKQNAKLHEIAKEHSLWLDVQDVVRGLIDNFDWDRQELYRR